MVKAIIQNKSKVIIHGLKPGGKLPIEVDCEGTPLDKHWRRRIADSKIDGAISIVKKDSGLERKPTPERVEIIKKKEVKK